MIKPNTPAHERLLSDVAKGMVGPLINVCTELMNKSNSLNSGNDPIAAERYILLTSKVSEIAARMYQLGEDMLTASLREAPPQREEPKEETKEEIKEGTENETTGD